MLTPLLLAAAAGYLLGSMPFGYLVARAKGVNIFEVGSGNPGATNVRRVLGHGPGNLVLALDAVKGAMAAGWPMLLSGAHVEQMAIVGLGTSILGHSFSCFTGFRGGKSVATGAGAFAVLFPPGALAALGVWLATLGLTRYVSLASMLSAVAIPVAALLLHQSAELVGVSVAIAVFVILRHRSNIARLLAGTETKIGRKSAMAEPGVQPKS